MTENLPIVQRSVIVPFGLKEAFCVFVERFDSIKPREHNLLAVPIAETILEARIGGRIFDRGSDGTECTWGVVLAIDAPHSLRFAWLIGPDWRVQPEEFASEVEVQFIAEGENHTNVHLEHRHIERHGPGWEAVRRGVDGNNGWAVYLARFSELIQHHTNIKSD